MISLNSKRELWMATRLSSALLLFDTLFRFKAVQTLVIAGTSPDDTRTGLLIAISVTFACCYVGGMSCLFAFSFERTRIKHFRLGLFCGGNPVRLVRLAFGYDQFTRAELASYKSVRGRAVWAHRCSTAAPTASPSRHSGITALLCFVLQLMSRMKVQNAKLVGKRPTGASSSSSSSRARAAGTKANVAASATDLEMRAPQKMVTTLNPLTLKQAGVGTGM